MSLPFDNYEECLVISLMILRNFVEYCLAYTKLMMWISKNIWRFHLHQWTSNNLLFLLAFYRKYMSKYEKSIEIRLSTKKSNEFCWNSERYSMAWVHTQRIYYPTWHKQWFLSEILGVSHTLSDFCSLRTRTTKCPIKT